MVPGTLGHEFAINELVKSASRALSALVLSFSM